MKLFRVRGVEDSEMLVRTPASGSIGETMKQPEPVNAWSYTDLNGRLKNRAWNSRAYAAWCKPKGIGRVVRVEIRPVKTKGA
jgi:hypothetical protein